MWCSENTLTRPFHYTRFYQTPVGPITAWCPLLNHGVKGTRTRFLSNLEIDHEYSWTFTVLWTFMNILSHISTQYSSIGLYSFTTTNMSTTTWIWTPSPGKYLNSGFDRSSFLKTDNSNEFSSSCTTRIVPILTTGVSFLRSYKVSNKRPIMGHPRSDLGCPRSVLVGPGQSQDGLDKSRDTH